MAIGQYFRQFITPDGVQTMPDPHAGDDVAGEYVATALQAATIAPKWLRKSIVSGVSDVLDCPVAELDFMFETARAVQTSPDEAGEDANDMEPNLSSDLTSDLSADLALPEYGTYLPPKMFARPSAL